MTVNHQSPNGQQSNATWPFHMVSLFCCNIWYLFSLALRNCLSATLRNFTWIFQAPRSVLQIQMTMMMTRMWKRMRRRVRMSGPKCWGSLFLHLAQCQFWGNQEKWSTWTGCSGKWCCHHFRTGGQQRGWDRNLSARVHLLKPRNQNPRWKWPHPLPRLPSRKRHGLQGLKKSRPVWKNSTNHWKHWSFLSLNSCTVKYFQNAPLSH